MIFGILYLYVEIMVDTGYFICWYLEEDQSQGQAVSGAERCEIR